MPKTFNQNTKKISLGLFWKLREERFEIAIDQSYRAHRDLKQDEFI